MHKMEQELLSPSERVDIHTWLLQKLQDERRDVLLHLEDKHRELLEQLLVRTNTVANPPLVVPAVQQKLLATEHHEQFKEVADKLQVNMGEKSDEYEPKVQQQQEQNDASGEDYGNSLALNSDVSGQDIHTQVEHTATWIAFEWFFGAVILANAVTIAFSQQYHGLQRGYDLGYDSYDSSKEDVWPGAQTALDVCELSFTILFTIEFLARWAVLKLRYLRDAWCYLDGCILIFAWLVIFNVKAVQFNPTFARLARVTKMLRLIHLLSSNSMVDVLKLMLVAIGASFATLVWSVVILWMVIFGCALLMVQLTESYLEESHVGDPNKLHEQQEVFQYFGTFYRALLTMFEITFANWVPSCRILMENVDERFAIFYFVYRCLIGLAVLMVVQAIFIQQTMKAAHLDDEILAKQKRKEKTKSLHRVERLFRRLDLNKDGVLEEAEFHEALKQEEMENMMEVFELEVWHIHELFNLVENGTKEIRVDEFVSNVRHLQGQARAIDMIYTKREVRQMKHLVTAIWGACKEVMVNSRSHITVI